MKIRSPLFALILVLPIIAYGQRQLSGNVVDRDTKQNIAHASIYVPQLKLGAVTDSQGHFQLANLPEGRHLLEVSILGYRNETVTVDLATKQTIEILLLPSAIETEEVVIVGASIKANSETTHNIAQLSHDEIQARGSLNLSDALAQIPGISQITTGPMISKPVLRGLYGNRIQVNINGIRFDNQQWQDEHGLGLGTAGIDRVEVIKGPASVLYGSDAMGGVINVIEEKPAAIGDQERDLSLTLFSNTFGLSGSFGKKSSNESGWRKFRASVDSHADYTDGKGERVLNSRSDNYSLKTSWGKKKENRYKTIGVNAAASRFGFVFDSLARKNNDGRLSRTFDGPHHTVAFGQFNYENIIYQRSRELKINGGFISNLRLEDEGGGGISLSMLLNTASLAAQFSKPIGQFGRCAYGMSGLFQTNTNFGGRIIIPDAIQGEISAFGYYQYIHEHLLFEAGLRMDGKSIKTFETNSLNIVGNESPTQEILPFTSRYAAYNGSVGAGYHLDHGFGVKINASTGYRPGNLAELSSNGLHEGTLRWEIGLPKAKIEQNLNVEGTLMLNHPGVKMQLSGYRNMFRNFIYLSPTGSEYFGFYVYHFRQTNATLQGIELSTDVQIPTTPLVLKSNFSAIKASKQDGTALPFIPANRFHSELSYRLEMEKWHFLPFVGLQHTFGQTRPADFETSTAAYTLINLGFRASTNDHSIALHASNLTNKYYFDHLSRFKYYGLANMGRMITATWTHKF